MHQNDGHDREQYVPDGEGDFLVHRLRDFLSVPEVTAYLKHEVRPEAYRLDLLADEELSIGIMTVKIGRHDPKPAS